MDSLKYGPEHLITSLGYYLMGEIFINKKNIPEGEAFFAKVELKYVKIV